MTMNTYGTIARFQRCFFGQFGANNGLMKRIGLIIGELDSLPTDTSGATHNAEIFRRAAGNTFIRWDENPDAAVIHR